MKKDLQIKRRGIDTLLHGRMMILKNQYGNRLCYLFILLNHTLLEIICSPFFSLSLSTSSHS